jgi:hypothetical protein
MKQATTSATSTQRLIGLWPVLALLVYFCIGLLIAYFTHGIRFDDPFITYRYTQNLIAGLGFRFNPDDATLITTAPLYALMLAAIGSVGADAPLASVLVGIGALVMAAWAIFLLGARHAQARAGFIGGLLLLLFPLSWLTLGFETPLFIAVALFTFLAVDGRKPIWAGVGAGVAVGLRGDGAIVAGVAALFLVNWSYLRQWLSARSSEVGQRIDRSKLDLRESGIWGALLAGGVGLIVYLPLALWLITQFGSPLPSTLQTKSAQAVSGLTGFYPFTSYLQGGGLLIQALVIQSPLLIIMFVLCGLGIAHALRERAACFAMPVIWGAAHLLGYSLLRVAPYVWYFAPIIPAVACLAGWGIDWVAQLARERQRLPMSLSIGLTSILLAGLVATDIRIIAVVNGATPPPPSDLRAKLLPETKVDVYARVGMWIQQNTPPDATLGVTELGVMSYYARRHTVDFLGLTQPGYLDGIRHGDYLQALIREQPDYVALNSVNAIYDFDPQRSTWYTALYTPVVSFDDARFWGSPMVVWQRKGAPITSSAMLDKAAHDLGDGWEITGIQASSIVITGGSPLMLRLQLKAGQAIGARTLRVQVVLIQGGDGLPVASRVIHTNLWQPGEVDWVDLPVMPQAAPVQGGYIVEASWLEGGPVVHAGNMKVPLLAQTDAKTQFAPLSKGVAVGLMPKPITACLGASTPITLTWLGASMDLNSYTAFVQLRNGATVSASADSPPRNGTYPTTVWSKGEVIPDMHSLLVPASVPVGTYTLVVGLYLPADNARWPVDASEYRTADGGVKIADVQVRQCQ